MGDSYRSLLRKSRVPSVHNYDSVESSMIFVFLFHLAQAILVRKSRLVLGRGFQVNYIFSG